MPIYEYYCAKCGAKFEKLLPIAKADKPGACPECGSKSTHRMMSCCAPISAGSAGESCLTPT